MASPPMRITGGIHRSRALRAPRGTATRPTSDRVREALFSILESMGVVEGARVLDLYAGTGALGLEALSRGAAAAVLVDSSTEALSALRTNVASLSLADRVRIVAGDVGQTIGRISREGPFDVIFADPPWTLFEGGRPQEAVCRLARAGAFADGAWLILEHPSRGGVPVLERLVAHETRRYGDTALSFFKIGILAAAGPPP